MEKKPVLSIGIIFKNEIRCLERCLKSLAPLREAANCELVMADTGSDDGSREIAERYADILFDFPWVNDFAAARNAVIDRCSGEWYFSLDADEWLDEDIQEFLWFLNGGGENWDFAFITERNYYSYDTNGNYGTFMPWRLMRLSLGVRYEGAIHEHWASAPKYRNLGLGKTLIHHDGYVCMYGPEGKEKRERNMKLLRKKLEEDPDSLLSRLQMIESGGEEPDYLDQVREAVRLVRKKASGWDTLGPSIFRHAINSGRTLRLPELEEWIHIAEELFLDSYFIRMDAAFNIAAYYWGKENFDACVHWGEIGLRAYEDFRAGKGDIACQLYGSLQTTGPLCEMGLRIVLARGYFEVGREDEALALLGGLDFSVLDPRWTDNFLETMQMVYFRSEREIGPLLADAWEGIRAEKPNREWGEKRRAQFIQTGGKTFTAGYQKTETKDASFRRHVWGMYKALEGRCVLGTAAAILESDSPAEIEELLLTVENWDELPVSALAHAVMAGTAFPVLGRPMRLEELDTLAARLVREREDLSDILKCVTGADFSGSWQSLTWARALVLAAVRAYDWKDGEKGLYLAHVFAKVERAFLVGCYTSEVLREENLLALPAMHRFGWYCAEAFDALEIGDSVEYIRLLRKGLVSCESRKDMVEFLINHTPELQTPPPSPELLELAEKVRAMLAAYSPDDPAVAALKASPAYQKVSYLIESAEPLGGQNAR